MSIRNKIILTCVSVILLVAILVPTLLVVLHNDMTTVTFSDTSEVLLNPGKGFVHYGADYNTQTKYERPYFTTGYHRFRWSDLEPEEGVYDFSKIDEWMGDYVHWGKKFAFGVMCVDSTYTKGEYVTPKYVFDKTEKYYVHNNNGKIQYIPDWEDEVFLNALDRLVAALGEEYNGNENVAFIDILSYGNFGEQHLFGLNVDEPNYSTKKLISPEFLKERYIQPYIDAFPDTMLVIPWGSERYDQMYIDLFDSGVTLRRDGICKYTNGLDTLASAYGKLPVIFEYAGNYKDNIEEGTEAEFNQMLEEAIQIAKPSYIELDNDWFEKNPEYMKDLSNRMGYYFRLKQAQYYKKIECDKATTINLTFANDGVAPIYEKCLVYVGLIDENGNLVKKYLTDLNAKTWLPGQQVTQSASVTIGQDIQAGAYTLALGLFKDENDENPTYLLGSTGKIENNWYNLGNIEIA